MSQPASPAVITRRDVYLLCPDLETFRATRPRPLQGVWLTVNNDFGAYKRKQKQLLKKKRKVDDADVSVTDEEAYAHTRELALRKHDASTASSVASTSASPPDAASSPARAEEPGHSATKEAFGDDCFPWAYWASQDSIAEHRLTGYYLTDRQWLNRVVKLIETLGDLSHLDSWNHRALDHRPFEDRHIVEAGRTAALPSRPDAVELIQRQVAAQIAGTLERLQRTINAKLELMEMRNHPPSLDQATNPAHAPSPSSSQQSVSSSHQSIALKDASDSSAIVFRVPGEEKVVDYEEGELFLDCVAPSSARSTLPNMRQSEANSGEKPQSQPQEQPSPREQHQQPLVASLSSSSHSSHPCRSAIESIHRVPFDNVEFVNPRHRSRRWQLTYRGKGTFAQVYVGKSQHDSDPARVAIKFALDPSTQNIDRELIHEAEMVERVARVSPHAVCQLLFRPRPDDDVVTMGSGARQPVFIAMELVDCDFGELERSGQLSRCAMCEGFLLSFLTLWDVHRSGVLHRDLKLNNLSLCINNTVDSTAVRSDICSRDARLSARILDFGEAVPLRLGDRGPTSYGQCRSEYASIARHNGEEQGFKDDIEMLLYAFLDKMMTGGLPWKQQQGEDRQRVGRTAMSHMKISFRRFKGEQSEMHLINALSALDTINARVDPPYQAVEEALRRAWDDEWREHHSRGPSKPKRLYECIRLLGRR